MRGHRMELGGLRVIAVMALAGIALTAMPRSARAFSPCDGEPMASVCAIVQDAPGFAEETKQMIIDELAAALSSSDELVQGAAALAVGTLDLLCPPGNPGCDEVNGYWQDVGKCFAAWGTGGAMGGWIAGGPAGAVGGVVTAAVACLIFNLL